MRAIRQYEFGPAEMLHYETVDDPAPGAGQIRIAVKASGVHLIETWLRGGSAVGPHPVPELPMTPGGEVAGVVDALGSGTDEELLGKRVVASLNEAGGYAELAVADVSDVHELPDELGFPAAVAMLSTGTTAMAVLEIAELTAEDVVLVTAAAGGIGSLLVQRARQLGATVIGAAGGQAKTDVVDELGANVAVDYSATDWTDTLKPAGVTVVLDGVGGEIGRAAYGLVASGGRVISFGAASKNGDIPFANPEVESGGVGFQSLFTSPVMEALQDPDEARGIQARALAAAIAGLEPLVQTFELAEAAAAHRALETRQTVGKVVLVTG